MNDLSWMLKPQAIRCAKECQRIVQQELGVKLKLSHPEFIQMLHKYVELSGSSELGKAYSRLLANAGVGFVINSLKDEKESSKVAS